MKDHARTPTLCSANAETFVGPLSRWRAAALVMVAATALTGAGPSLAGKKKEPAVKAAKESKPAGSLVIVGGGLLPQAVRDRFLELAGGRSARIVVIPTASGKAEAGRLESLRSYADWSPLARSGKVKSLYFLHTRRHDVANSASFVKPLRQATGVWFTGGDQSLLMAAYRGTAVERELRAVLERGGVIGGTSAGAAVMSEIMIRYGNPVAEVGRGFGFLRGVVVDQHFGERRRQARLVGVLARHPNCLGLGIDEQTAVVVQGLQATVLGNRHVHVYVPGRAPARDHKSGATIDLAALARLLVPAVTAAAPPVGKAPDGARLK